MLKVLLVILVACGSIESLMAEEVEEPSVKALFLFDKLIDSKIAGGSTANKSLKLDFALLAVTFINQRQTCGGALISAQWILTSATCLQE